MSRQRVRNYTFSAAAKTLTFNDYQSVNLDRVLVVTNVTRNVVVYNFADATGSATVSGNVLTFTASTAGMVDSDRFIILCEPGPGDPWQDPTIPVSLPAGTTVQANNQVQGEDQVPVAPGVPLTALAGPTGDPVDTTGDALAVFARNAGDVQPPPPGLAAANPGQRAQIGVGGKLDVPWVYNGVAAVGPTIDTAGFESFVVFSTVATGPTVIVQQSSDGLVWTVPPMYPAVGGFPSTTGVGLSNASGAYFGLVTNRYIRMNISGAPLGAGVLRLLPYPLPIPGPTASASGAAVDAVANALASFASYMLSFGYVFNGTNWDRARGATAAGNVAATGLPAAALMGQFDDTLPTATTENQFGNLRTSQNRSLYTALRDGSPANAERGAAVTAANELVVNDSAGQLIGGDPIATTAPGTQLVSLAGPTGDPLDQIGSAVAAYLTNTAAADGAPVNPSSAVLRAIAEGFLFNGTTWEPRTGNRDATLVNAVAATTTQTASDQTNYNARGVKVVLDMTTVGTGSVTITIQGKDAASGKYYTILAGAAVTTNSTNVYTVYPGAPATANVSANDILPRQWRVLVTANNANPTTYTVGASVIL